MLRSLLEFRQEWLYFRKCSGISLRQVSRDLIAGWQGVTKQVAECGILRAAHQQQPQRRFQVLEDLHGERTGEFVIPGGISRNEYDDSAEEAIADDERKNSRPIRHSRPTRRPPHVKVLIRLSPVPVLPPSGTQGKRPSPVMRLAVATKHSGTVVQDARRGTG